MFHAQRSEQWYAELVVFVDVANQHSLCVKSAQVDDEMLFGVCVSVVDSGCDSVFRRASIDSALRFVTEVVVIRSDVV